MNDLHGPSHDQPRDEERLRRLLDDTVSGVEPREGLDSIRARTAVSPLRRKRPWLLGAGAGVVATAATIAAVAMLAGGPGTTGTEQPGFATEAPTTTGPEPSPSGDTSETPASPPVEVAVPVYYVGDTSRGPRLFREFHPGTGASPALASARDAVEGNADDPEYLSMWPEGTTVHGVSFDGIGDDGVIQVDLGPASLLHDRPASMTEEEAAISVEQLVYSVQAATGTRAAVELYLDGQKTDMVLGVPASEPLAQGDPMDVLAQVWIIDPGEGAEVTSPFTVSGLAAAFEANVQWELLRDGEVVDSGFTTAEECCTMAPYSFRVSAEPGEYTIVVHDTDPSGGEGFAPWEDSKTVRVVP